MVRGLMPASCHCTTARAEAADGGAGDGREGRKSVLGMRRDAIALVV